MSRWRAELVRTAFEARQFPEPKFPEVALAGRSNVGKSSLLNALIDQKIAHISSKPGKTRSINFFEVSSGGNPFTLVDLPGYGFASRSKKEQDQWRKLIERYVSSRQNLSLVIHLVDFRHGLLKNDVELQDWISALGVPMLTVFTKVDKIARGKRKGELHKYIKSGLKSVDVPILTSTEGKLGVEELRTFISAYLEEWNRYVDS
ncbi:MAG: ribosome biogenesis GTP-binding protein YihA/YsxC [Synergistota bacterium]|jgi:GTP-binding protein|nr:ribosome biogenesis GTP-binding protein YihA/YsxC [Synergistota bacterium]